MEGDFVLKRVVCILLILIFLIPLSSSVTQNQTVNAVIEQEMTPADTLDYWHAGAAASTDYLAASVEVSFKTPPVTPTIQSGNSN